MPTSNQDKEFAEEMKDCVDEVKMGHRTLDNAIVWIGNQLDPDDVFSEKQLSDWAESNGYIKQ